MTESILVVVAHPDDEVLGMAGTLIRHAEQGDYIELLILSDGVGSRGNDTAAQQRRKQAAEEAATLMGISAIHWRDFPDNGFDSIPLLQIVQQIETIKRQLQPTRVYTHHSGDLNIDHQYCCRAVMTAFRPQPGESCQQLLSFEVASSTEWSSAQVSPPFLPDQYVEVTHQLDQALQAYRCYGEEIRPDPHPRSEHAFVLSRQQRGREVGYEAAEAFTNLRRLIPATANIV